MVATSFYGPARAGILTLLSLGTITVAIAMAASRGTLLWTAGSAVVCVVAFLWGCPWQRGQLVRVLRSFQRTLIIAVLSLGMAIFLFPTEVTNRFTFYWETLSLTSPTSELLQRTGDYPIRNFLYAFDNPRWPYGFGIGTASLGTQYVARIFHVPLTGFAVESGYGSIVVELGVVGLFLWLIMTSRNRRLCLESSPQNERYGLVPYRLCHFLVCLPAPFPLYLRGPLAF